MRRNLVEVGRFRDLRNQDGVGPRLGRGGEVFRPPLAVERIDPHDHLAGAEAARLDRVRDLLPRRRLGLGGDGILEIENDGIAGQGLGFFERARIRSRHVEHAAARTDGHVGKLPWS